MRIDFFFDPTCPWCWITSRWITEVQSHRDIDVRWRAFSLALKNEDETGEDSHSESAAWGLSALRVVEAVRAELGHEPVARLYTEYGAVLHHDGVRFPDHAAVLSDCGLDQGFAQAAGDASWNMAIESSMKEAIDLAGDDVGVPTIVYDGKAAFFGPVFSPAPTGEAALVLWDSLAAMATLPGFYELKRTREIGPRFGARPSS